MSLLYLKPMANANRSMSCLFCEPRTITEQTPNDVFLFSVSSLDATEVCSGLTSDAFFLGPSSIFVTNDYLSFFTGDIAAISIFPIVYYVV
jgi:hypothetical protein